MVVMVVMVAIFKLFLIKWYHILILIQSIVYYFIAYSYETMFSKQTHSI